MAKKKEKESKKYLSRPKISLPTISARKIINSIPYNPLVKAGRTGYFNEEYQKETKWLS